MLEFDKSQIYSVLQFSMNSQLNTSQVNECKPVLSLSTLKILILLQNKQVFL